MQESTDLAIKLFGKKIPLPSEEETPAAAISGYDLASESESSERDLVNEDDDKDPNNISNPKTPSISEEASKKKKILLRCPRCNSMDTKFCYFNNYNVKQPRHLCKSCQRYWTAGGTMRTVPVGSGRRRSKSSARFQPSNPEEEQKGSCCSSSSAAEASPNFQFLPYNWWFNFPPLPPAVVGKRRQREEDGGGAGVLVPKTLRMDDPSQVAKSSIWTTLGIDKDGVGMMFRGFGSKKNSSCDRYDGHNTKSSNADCTKSTSNQLLLANPSALSRSMNFHETS